MNEKNIKENLEICSNEVFANEATFCESDISDLKKESKKTSNKIIDLKIMMKREWEGSKGNLSYSKEKDGNRGEMAELVMDFEIEMFSDFSLESDDLDPKESNDKRKFNFWKEILLNADKICRRTKKEFRKRGFTVRQEVRESVSRNLVGEHTKLFNLLIVNKTLLPEDTVDELIEANKRLQRLNVRGIKKRSEEEKDTNKIDKISEYNAPEKTKGFGDPTIPAKKALKFLSELRNPSCGNDNKGQDIDFGIDFDFDFDFDDELTGCTADLTSCIQRYERADDTCEKYPGTNKEEYIDALRGLNSSIAYAEKLELNTLLPKLKKNRDILKKEISNRGDNTDDYTSDLYEWHKKWIIELDNSAKLSI